MATSGSVENPAPDGFAALQAGMVVFERYELREVLGRGGMGIVWRAWDRRLEIETALKFLPEVVARDPEAARDLRQETRLAITLVHRHIVGLRDLVEAPGMVAIAMEVVDGGSLAQRKADSPAGALEVDELRPWVEQICGALDYAHGQAHVVHRDLKPANVLLTPGGVAKIADFGIARSLADTKTRLSVAVGGTSGTLLYMSPQQLAGKRPTASDDIYALGVMLYELLAGKPPFFRGDISMQVRASTPDPIAERRAELGITGLAPVPESWEQAIMDCLAKDPPGRPASAGEVWARLKVENLSGMEGATIAPWAVAAPTSTPAPEPVAAEPEPEPTPAPEPLGFAPPPPDPASVPPPSPVSAPGGEPESRKQGLLLALLGLVAIIACGAGIWWFLKSSRGSPEAAPRIADTPTSTLAPAAAMPPEVAAKPTREAEAEPEPPAVAFVPPAPAAVYPLVVRLTPPVAAARLFVGQRSPIPFPGDGQLSLDDISMGAYVLRVEAPGYNSITRRIDFSPAISFDPVEVTLTELRAGLVVQARPGSAVVALAPNGKTTALGTVPAGGRLVLTEALAVGRYTLRVEHPDCLPVERENVVLASDQSPAVTFTQVPRPGEVRVTTQPTGARVWLNDGPAITAPATLRDVPSEVPVTLSVRLAGYRTHEQTLTLKPREILSIAVPPLIAEVGALYLKFSVVGDVESMATVRLDGRTVRPQGGLLEKIPPGTYQLEISHPDFADWTQPVDVRDADVTEVEINLVGKRRPAAAVAEVVPPPSAAETKESPTALTPAPAPKSETVAQPRITFEPTQPVAPTPATVSFQEPTPPKPTPPSPPPSTVATETPRVTFAPTVAPEQPSPEPITPEPAAMVSGRGPADGESWNVPDLGLELLPIPAGRFTMGAASRESGRGSDEGPQTEVTISRPFWLGRTEVTQSQFEKLMGHNPSNASALGGNAPVEQVTWDEAMEYCRTLTTRQRAAGRLSPGQQYSLPTEAQWEYACRAGTTGPYAGSLIRLAWYGSSSRTQAVATKAANAWGLYDMHGNVWEWCLDWYAPSLPGGSVTDPTGPATGTERVDRGGGWNSSGRFVRSASRGKLSPSTRSHGLGFRVALVMTAN